MLKKRATQGKYATLYKELTDDETKFHEYFRLSQYALNILLKKIQNDLQKLDTRWREAVTPKECLAVFQV
jgi:hypothetical protein